MAGCLIHSISTARAHAFGGIEHARANVQFEREGLQDSFAHRSTSGNLSAPARTKLKPSKRNVVQVGYDHGSSKAQSRNRAWAMQLSDKTCRICIVRRTNICNSERGEVSNPLDHSALDGCARELNAAARIIHFWARNGSDLSSHRVQDVTSRPGDRRGVGASICG
jgi:hypothetical protein